jgi:3-phenylpropionate/cinnamic acid dioxygenase small subunit
MSQSDTRARSRTAFASVLTGALIAASLASAAELTVEERLRRLDDESQIRHLLDEYMDVLGASDWDNYVLFFAENGALEMAEGIVTGREAIHARMATAAERMARAAASRPPRQRADLLSNIRVEVDGDTATARSRFTFLGEDENGDFRVTGSGLYIDRWIRMDGEWKIQRRKVDWDMLRGQAVTD